MRTTLEIEDELLLTLKELAGRQGVTLGRLISELTRRSLTASGAPIVRNGVPVFTPKDSNTRPDLQLVNALRDDS
jgi:hypothetical protein